MPPEPPSLLPTSPRRAAQRLSRRMAPGATPPTLANRPIRERHQDAILTADRRPGRPPAGEGPRLAADPPVRTSRPSHRPFGWHHPRQVPGRGFDAPERSIPRRGRVRWLIAGGAPNGEGERGQNVGSG